MLIRWLAIQTVSFREALGQLQQAPLASLVTCLVIGVTLAFPLMLQVALANGRMLSRHATETLPLTVWLKPAATEGSVRHLVQLLAQRTDVNALKTLSPAESLNELGEQENLSALTDSVAENPLPWVIVVTPAHPDPATLADLKQFIEKQPDTASVRADTAWAARLASLLDMAHRLTLFLTGLLAVSVFFITGHAIWTVIGRYQQEIRIIRLAGGTAAFIRKPFLYAGVLYGLLGGLVATGLVTLLARFLRFPLHQLMLLSRDMPLLTGPDFPLVLSLLGCSMLLGFLGALAAVTCYLRLPETGSLVASGETC